MAEANGKDHLPFRPLRARDQLDDGEDVTVRTDRELMLRAVNSTLRTEQAVGAMTAEISKLNTRMTSDIAAVSGKVTALGKQVRDIKRRFGGEEIEMRAKQASRPALEELEEKLEEATTGPHAALTERDLQFILVKREAEAAKVEAEAAKATAKAEADSARAAANVRDTENKAAMQRRDDRKWAVAMIFITAIALAGLAVVGRLLEASIRGHW